ncbi:helix-turn-helix domain-containing protein [Enterococcus durans]
MELIYPNGEAYLIISPNLGIQLFRRSSSLQYLYDDFYSSDLFYEIIEQLIQQRQFSTNEFCDKYGVSVSKLKRKIKEINKLVNHYQMHISVSAKVTIKAEEAQLRMFSYAFLYGIHRQFSRIDWIKNKKFIWELSRKILTHLAVSPSEQSLELLSIWLYVQLNAMEQESRLTFTLRQTLLLKTLSIPEKPAFLSEWHQTDWQLLIAFIQTSDIFGY